MPFEALQPDRYQTLVADRGPSPDVWNGVDELLSTGAFTRGMHFWDDFLKGFSLAAPGADTTSDVDGYSIFVNGTTSGNAAIVHSAIDIETVRKQNAYGILAYDSAGTAVDEEAMVLMAKGAPALLESSTTLAVFECRIKLSSVADTLSNVFIGLAEAQALTTIVPITATADTMADINHIGFLRPETNGDVIAFTYKADGQTVQTPIASAAVPAADTWIKLGFRLDAAFSAATRLSVYVDGTVLGTYVTATNMDAATFPDDVGLCPVFAAKAAATSDYGIISLDWWRLFCRY